MLVQDFVDVPRPLLDVEKALRRLPDITAWSEAARGAELAVGPTEALQATVEVDVGEPVHATNSVAFPVSWKAKGSERLFPHMQAELVLAELTPDVTHLVFRGSYQPPFSGIGEMLDRIAFHRLAEATVRNFLERLAGVLVEWIDAQSSGPDGGTDDGSAPRG